MYMSRPFTLLKNRVYLPLGVSEGLRVHTQGQKFTPRGELKLKPLAFVAKCIDKLCPA
jgi:hypothetical protein